MFGKVIGRFFLEQHLGITTEDETQDTTTISELVETFHFWPTWIGQIHTKHKFLYTMFETTDVHPDIIKSMKWFDKVIVPFDYLKNILEKHGVTCEATNFYTSDLIRMKPEVIPKTIDPLRKVFLYVGTNDTRKNVTTLTEVFAKATEGTDHCLVVKTDKLDGLTVSKNIRYVTDKIPLEKLASLYNLCDYVISFTRGEGVGLPMLEASYFNKPIIAHDQGVFTDIKKYVSVPWITLPSREIHISLDGVPSYLHQVFYGTWFEVDKEAALKIIKDIVYA